MAVMLWPAGRQVNSNEGEKPGDERGTVPLKNKVARPALVDGQANQWPVELAAIHIAIF